MKKKDRLKRDFKQQMINQAILNHWWGLVGAVETLRANPDDRMAIFELGTTIQCLIFLSLEYGTHRLLKALPEEQRDLLDTIIIEGSDLARDSLEHRTLLFEGMDFPSADKVFELISGLKFSAPTKPEQE